jgi:hypothetical protein
MKPNKQLIDDYTDLVTLIRQRNYKKILVSGPQRSGTTFLSHILATDLDWGFFDEARNINAIKRIEENTVIQCPNLCFHLHLIEEPNTLLVYLVRNGKEIDNSAKKTYLSSLDCTWYEFSLKVEMPKCEKAFPEFYIPKIDSQYLKQNIWLSFQVFNMKLDSVTFPYTGLMSDTRFLTKDKRGNFAPKQTTPRCDYLFSTSKNFKYE